MLILFLFLYFIAGYAHAAIDTSLEENGASMSVRWINAALSGVSYGVIFYFAMFFL